MGAGRRDLAIAGGGFRRASPAPVPGSLPWGKAVSAAERGVIGYRGKRALDLAIALPALVLLAPVMAVVAALVALRMGRPVIFVQMRPGLGAEPFPAYKFRTMTNARDAAGHLLPDSDRLTPLGRFLRASSLDELPGLWNVVRGEMSLVGPRPLVATYLPWYTDHERTRFAVWPGITGWAQVNGRNALDWEARFALDLWYVDHLSFWLDLRIIARTVARVLRREGITEAGHATMSEYTGARAEGVPESVAVP